jgi:hypothetical protein
MAVSLTTPNDASIGGNVVCQGKLLPQAAGFGSTLLTDTPSRYLYRQSRSVNVASDTQDLHIAKSAGTIINLLAVMTGAVPASGSITVDLQRSTGGGAFATVLNSVINITNANTVRVPVSGTINTSALGYLATDVFEIVVVLSGAGGGQGLSVEAQFNEGP